MKHKIHIC